VIGLIAKKDFRRSKRNWLLVQVGFNLKLNLSFVVKDDKKANPKMGRSIPLAKTTYAIKPML
jgi:hypothetical protein